MNMIDAMHPEGKKVNRYREGWIDCCDILCNALSRVMKRIDDFERTTEHDDIDGIVSVSQQRTALGAFAEYMMEHSNCNDGKTAKDYVSDFMASNVKAIHRTKYDL